MEAILWATELSYSKKGWSIYLPVLNRQLCICPNQQVSMADFGFLTYEDQRDDTEQKNLMFKVITCILYITQITWNASWHWSK